MSTSTTSTANTSAPAAGDNSQSVDMLMQSAAAAVATFRPAFENAERVQQSIRQTIAACVIALCEAEVYVSVKLTKSDGSLGKDVSSSSTLAALIQCDADNRQPNSAAPKLYEALYTFVCLNLGCERQVGQNIVSFAARLARLGYKLSDFNGTVAIRDGKLVVQVADHDETKPQHTWPGFFRIKPLHVASTGFGPSIAWDVEAADEVQTIREGVKLSVFVKSPEQSVVLADRFVVFINGEPDAHGQKPFIRTRLGMATFDRTTKAVLAAEHARKLKAENDARIADEAKRNPPQSDSRGPKEDRPDGSSEPASNAPPVATSTPPAPASNGTATPAPAAPAAPASPAPAAAVTNASNTDNTGSRASVGETTRNAEPRREDAMTPEKLLEAVRVMFSPARSKENPDVMANLLLLHAYTSGVLKTLGTAEAFLKNPTDDAARKLAKVTVPNTSNRKPQAR